MDVKTSRANFNNTAAAELVAQLPKGAGPEEIDRVTPKFYGIHEIPTQVLPS